MTYSDPQPGDVPIVEVDIRGLPTVAPGDHPPIRGSHGGRRLLGLAGLVAVASVVAALFALRGGDDGAGAGAAERYFELWPAPEGTKAWAPDTDGASSQLAIRTAFFGDKGADDPFTKSDAYVSIVSTEGSSGGDDGSGDGSAPPVRVRDTTGRIRSDDTVGFSVRVLTFFEPGRRVIVVSRHLSADAMVEFANALADGAEPNLNTPVRGMSRIAVSSPIGGAFSADGATRTVTYIASSAARSGGAPLTLSFGPGGADALRAARWWGGVPTTVGGHRAMAVSLANGTSTGLNRIEWVLDDGTLLSVSGPLDLDGLRSLASTVREIDRARFDEFVGSPEPFEALASGSATSASGPVRMIPGSDGPTRATLAGVTSGIAWVVEDHVSTLCVRLGPPADQLEQACGSASIGERLGVPVVPSVVVDGSALFVVPAPRGTVSVTLQSQDAPMVAMSPVGDLGDVSLFAAVLALPVSPSAGAPFVFVMTTAPDGSTSTRRMVAPALGLPPSVPTTQ